jgi:hypothetical protein
VHVLMPLTSQSTAPHAAERSIPCPVILRMEAAHFGSRAWANNALKWRTCASSNAVSRPVPASGMNEQRSSQLRIACSLGPLPSLWPQGDLLSRRLGAIECVGVEAMQAVGHMVAEVDACQRALAEVLCIHNLHGTLTTLDSYNAEYKGLSPEGVVLVCLEGQAMQAIGLVVAKADASQRALAEVFSIYDLHYALKLGCALRVYSENLWKDRSNDYDSAFLTGISWCAGSKGMRVEHTSSDTRINSLSNSSPGGLLILLNCCNWRRGIPDLLKGPCHAMLPCEGTHCK